MKKIFLALILSIVAISLISTVIAVDINGDGISDGVVVKKDATPLKIKFIPFEQIWTKNIKVGDLLRDNNEVTYKVLQKTHDNQSRLCYQLKDLNHTDNSSKSTFWVVYPSFKHYDKINGTDKNSTHNDTNGTPQPPHKDIAKKKVNKDKKQLAKMKNTGIPIAILVLAILGIIFGYKRRK